MNKYNVSSFPTVKLISDEETIDFESKITRTTLTSFVNTMLNNWIFRLYEMKWRNVGQSQILRSKIKDIIYTIIKEEWHLINM